VSTLSIVNVNVNVNQSICLEILEWSKYFKHCYRSTIIDSVQTQKYHMSRMSGYDSVNRNVLSRVRTVVRDGADVTSGGTPGASNRKCTVAKSGAVNRKLDETVAARRAKHLATWKVGNVDERAKVRDAQPWRTLYASTARLDLMRSGTRSQ